MENRSQELDDQDQEEHKNHSQQKQDTNRAGYYNNDAGVIPDDELKGSDADTDSGIYTDQDILSNKSDDAEAAEKEAGEKNLDKDIDKGINESTSGSAS